MVAELTAVVLFASARPRLELAWVFDPVEGRRLVAAGLPLGLGSIVYWVYRMVGTTSVALATTARTLGLYAFAVGPITILTRTLAMADGVLTPVLWEEMASDSEQRTWVPHATRITIALAVAAAVVTNLSQAGFGPVVGIVVPSFRESVPIFGVLALSVWPLSICTVPSLILNSAAVERQRTALVIAVGGLGVNVVANAAVLLLGAGVMAVAWNDVWIQLVGAFFLFEASARNFEPGRRRFFLYGALAGIGAVALGIYLVLRHWMNDAGSKAMLVVRLVERIGLVSGIWGALVLGGLLWVRRRHTPELRGVAHHDTGG
jgi:O-antigen/teichoic acid export membrane protein